MKVAILGEAGFIGRAVKARAEAMGHALRPAPRLRVEGAGGIGDDAADAAQRWLRARPSESDAWERQLAGVDVVVNAAGLAAPESGDEAALFDANAVVPGVLAELAFRAGVRRLIHVSTAAVQGRRDPLDETAEVEPFSPYTRTKAAGEAVLLERGFHTPREVVVYRPTSVQAPDRALTRRLVAVASKAVVPVPANGDVPLPVCLAENMAAGIVHCISMEVWPAVVLQPWEGMTTRFLLESLGHNPLLVPVPPALARAAVRVASRTGRGSPRLAAVARRLDLLAFGQGQQANALREDGFRLPAGVEAYKLMAERIRANQ